MEAIVTVQRRAKPQAVEDALKLSKKLSLKFVERKDASVESLLKAFGKNVLVVFNDGSLTLFTLKGNRLFFHPGLFKIRLIQYLRGEPEWFSRASGIKEGDSVLDCNLGLAQDALLAAFITKRKVIGLEVDPIIAEIVRRGLKSYRPKGKLKLAEKAFKLIEVLNKDNSSFLFSAKENSFDVVYFSPMFIKPKFRCDVMTPFREVAFKGFPDEKTIEQAVRVARKRVVIKINEAAASLFPYLSEFELSGGAGHVKYLVYKKAY